MTEERTCENYPLKQTSTDISLSLDQIKKYVNGQKVTYDEILEMNRDKLLENPKEPRRVKKRFLKKQLSQIMDGYKKNNLKFYKLLDRIDNAIRNETNFCEDINALDTNLGSNVGLLIKELKET